MTPRYDFKFESLALSLFPPPKYTVSLDSLPVKWRKIFMIRWIIINADALIGILWLIF